MKPTHMILYGVKSGKTPPSLYTEEEGSMGRLFLQVLHKADIHDRKTFLKECATEKGRSRVAKETGLSAPVILRFANHMDLMRVKGIDEKMAVLLEDAGVDSPTELAMRNPEHLIQKLEETAANAQTPKLEDVVHWISQAQDHTKLPKIITHGATHLADAAGRTSKEK